MTAMRVDASPGGCLRQPDRHGLDLTHAAYQDMSPPSPVSEDRRQAVEEKLVARLNRLTDFFRTLMYWLRPT